MYRRRLNEKKRIEGTNCFPTAHESPVSTEPCGGLREVASKRKKSIKATATTTKNGDFSGVLLRGINLY